MSFDVLQAAVSRPSLWAFGLVWAAGLLVLLSPVALPAVSTMLGAVTGAGERKGWPAAGLSGAFVAGMAVTDAALGAALGLLGAAVIRLLITNLVRVQLVLGVVLLLLALVMCRRVRIPLGLPDRPTGRIRRPRDAFLLGLPFGLLSCPGCTPLLFPIAAGIAATGSPVYGAALMAAFALGEGLPMVVLGAGLAGLVRSPAIRRLTGVVERASALLFALGGGYLLLSGVRGLLRV